QTRLRGIIYCRNPYGWKISSFLLPRLRHLDENTAASRYAASRTQIAHALNHLVCAFSSFKRHHTTANRNSALPDIKIAQTKRGLHRKFKVLAFSCVRCFRGQDLGRKRGK